MRRQVYPYTGHFRCAGAAALWLCLDFDVCSGVIVLGADLAFDQNSVLRVVTALGFAGCGALFFRAGVRYLFGHLVVDDEGVRVWPPGFGFSCRWDDLERWEVAKSDPGGEGEELVLELTLRTSRWPRRWHASFTGEQEFSRLVEEVRRRAPDRESSESVEPAAGCPRDRRF
jgi:hypothetical protein